MGRLPEFVIVGAMRAGTTSLTHYLRQHPQVYMPRKKELHYFDLHFSSGRSWYERQFASAPTSMVLGEATPNYMYLPRARERMARVLPHARLVVVLRNPVDRAYSHYLHNRYHGRDPLSFEDALAAEPERLATSAEPWRFAYADKGRYHDQLVDLFRLFGRTSTHVALFDQLVEHPGPTLSGVLRHIGAEASYAPPDLGRQVNRATTIRSVWLRDRARRLPPVLRDAVGRLNTTPARPEAMRQETRAALDASFADDNARLQDLLGISLSRWEAGGGQVPGSRPAEPDPSASR